ncbi:hypothetical protein HDU98_000132 [Podochytrium sp. JEL0797]|nr:hypothetical protein HDU98_000132 [Podochytrium sp. JEL0797]
MTYFFYESIVINGLEAFTVLRGGLPQMAAAFETLDQPRDRLKSLVEENSRLSAQCAMMERRIYRLESDLAEMSQARSVIQKSWSDTANKAAENGRMSFAYKGLIDLMMNLVPVENRSALQKHLEMAERGVIYSQSQSTASATVVVRFKFRDPKVAATVSKLVGRTENPCFSRI